MMSYKSEFTSAPVKREPRSRNVLPLTGFTSLSVYVLSSSTFEVNKKKYGMHITVSIKIVLTMI